MTKRNPGLPKKPKGAYDTPMEAVLPLLPHLKDYAGSRYAEPCAGKGYLIRHLAVNGGLSRFSL
jgi:hypothetical protein